MDAALVINLMLRGGAIALLVLLAAAQLREHPRAAAARLGAAFAIGTAASAVGSMPGFGDAFAWWHLPIVAAAAGDMFVFWLFTRALLDDAFALRPWHAAAWAGLAAVGVSSCLLWATGGSPSAAVVGPALTLVTIALAALSVAQSLGAWREDLVEGRRRVRMVIVASAAAYAALMALAALAPGSDAKAVFSGNVNAFGLAALSMLVAWQLLRLRSDGLIPEPAAVALDPAAPLAAPSEILSTAVEPDPRTDHEADPQLVAQLDRLMAVERVYREPDIGIGALAARMSLPEHKLRKLINRGLGYRNFSAFLNGYRIADAKRALADPQRADVPVLSIAMDAGFQSLGPFNRAFKESTGRTPSEYRRARALSAAAPAPLAETETG